MPKRKADKVHCGCGRPSCDKPVARSTERRHYAMDVIPQPTARGALERGKEFLRRIRHVPYERNSKKTNSSGDNADMDDAVYPAADHRDRMEVGAERQLLAPIGTL